MKNKNKSILLVLLIVLAIVLFVAIFWVIVFKDDSSSSADANAKTKSVNGPELVSCTSTTGVQPADYKGWKTRLYSAPLQDDSSNTDVPDNGARSFSIKALADKTSPNSIYHRAEHADGSMITGAKSVMEVCNNDNKAPKYYTTSTDTSNPASENTTAQIHYLHGGTYTAGGAGTYRIDGYIYVDGAWRLTTRISNVTLTD